MPTKVTDPAILAALNGGGQPAPAQQSPSAYPGVIQGRPKPPAEPTPVNPRTIYEDERDYGDKTKNDLFSNEQGLRKEFYSLPAVKEFQVASRTYANSLQAADDASGDQSLIVAYAKMLDPGSVVREGEAAAVAGADSTVGRSIAKLQKEFGFENGGQLSPEIRAKIRREMKTLAGNYGKAYDLERGQFEGLAQSYGFDANRVVGQHLLDPYRETIDGYWQKAEAAEAPPEEEEGALAGGVSYEGETWEQRQARELAEQRGRRGEGDAARLMRQGVTLGLSDEVAGIGTALGRALQGDFNVGANYRIGNQADDILNDQARENMGWGGTALEAISGGGGVRAVAGAAGSLVRQGVGLGSLGGFGYGEGLDGTATNALAGAAFGGGIGLAGQKVTNALTSRAQASGVPQRAAELNAAGRAEGVTVNRAMVDPQSNNAVTKTDATILGGRKVQAEMGKIEGQIEGRVQDLGRGGTPMLDPANGGTNRIALGEKVRGAGERFIETSGKAAKAKYDRAEQLAGGAKVKPQESLRRVDAMIAELSETGSTNQAELAFLQSIKDDLSKDLSVGALRRMRTALRKKISKGDLTFGESEARVLDIMDGAADDIRTGLTAQGKAKAARAFDAADKAYRARMEYINGTVQKILGKRQSNLSSEQVADKFISMTGSDAQGLRKFYATLEPDEAADVAATFAERIGSTAKDGFSVAQFMRQTSSKTMSDQALTTLFGKEGAESVRNLRTLGKEVERVTGAMNSRTSKSGVANYRDWLVNFALGGGGVGGGLLTGSATTGIALGAAAAGANTASSALSARALMSKNLTKWLSQAPATTSPAAINAHFGRLDAVLRAEPALQAEIEALRKGIMTAANDNVGISAAAGDGKEDQRQQ